MTTTTNPTRTTALLTLLAFTALTSHAMKTCDTTSPEMFTAENGECKPGYELNPDGKTCSDIDECLNNNGGCSHLCNNYCGGYECTCKPDFGLKEDGKTCYQDCEVGEWELAGECSATCGCGIQKQVRTVITNSENGKKCPKTVQFLPCKMVDCPINCEMGPWEDVGECDATCGGGLQEQHREIVQEAGAGGATCGPQTQQIPCNENPCPVDCTLGDWYASGECSRRCGDGEEVYHRDVITPAAYGGQECEEVTEKRPCFLAFCPVQIRMWRDTTTSGEPVAEDEIGDDFFPLPESEDGDEPIELPDEGCRFMGAVSEATAVSECTNKCNQVDECKGFTYHDDTKTCCFKSSTEDKEFGQSAAGVHIFEKCEGEDGACPAIPEHLVPLSKPRPEKLELFKPLYIATAVAILLVGAALSQNGAAAGAGKLFSSPVATPQGRPVSDMPNTPFYGN